MNPKKGAFYLMTTTRGIKKVSENILAEGRAIIVTEKDKNKYRWEEIPNGSKFIDTVTGIEQVKLEGQTDWVPSGVKNDGTLCIAKDSMIISEVFTIISLDDGTGKFVYTNSNGEQRHMQKTNEGHCVFELEEGSYMKLRNHLEIVIDDILHRDAASGGVIELSEKRFAVTDKLEVGHEITARYIRIFRIGNPYPRIFYNNETPEAAEIGDIWIDMDGTFEEGDILGDLTEANKKLSWDRVAGTPTTLAGYGIIDKVAYAGHVHTKDQITDFPKKMPADGGNADTVGNKSVGMNVGDIPYISADGKLPVGIIPTQAMSLLSLLLGNGATVMYDGQASITVTMNGTTTGVFDSSGKLSFPNGNKLWIE